METNPESLREDLDSLRSQAKRAIYADAAGKWYDDIPTVNGKKRAIAALNSDLDAVEGSQLVEFGPYRIDMTGAFQETLPVNAAFWTSATWYDSPAKAKKIADNLLTYNVNATVNTETWRLYAADGSTIIRTIVDTYDYAGGFMTPKVTRVVS